MHRLTQIRERGIQDWISKHFAVLKEPEKQPSIIDVSMVTAAPIMAVLAARYIIGIFVLLIERWVHETYWNSDHVEVFEDGGNLYIEGSCTINNSIN